MKGLLHYYIVLSVGSIGVAPVTDIKYRKGSWVSQSLLH